MTKEIETIALSNTEYFTIFKGSMINPNMGFFLEEDRPQVMGIPFLLPIDLNNHKVISADTSTRRTLNQGGISFVKDKIVPKYSTVLNVTGPSHSKISFTKVPCSISHYLIAVIIKDKNRLLPRYVFHMLSSLSQQMSLLAKGKKVPYIATREFVSLSMPLLSVERQTEIVEKMSF